MAHPTSTRIAAAFLDAYRQADPDHTVTTPRRVDRRAPTVRRRPLPTRAGGPLIGRSRAIQRLGSPQRTELRRRPEIVSISTVRPVWIECTMASSTPRYIMMCPG